MLRPPGGCCRWSSSRRQSALNRLTKGLELRLQCALHKSGLVDLRFEPLQFGHAVEPGASNTGLTLTHFLKIPNIQPKAHR